MQTNNALAALILAAAATTTAACGIRAKAPAVQTRGQVPLPAYPTDATQALQLTDAKTSYQFASNVLLWDNPTGEQVQAILDTTRQTRFLRADAIDVIKKEIIPAKQRLVDAQAAAAAAEQKVNEAQGTRDLVKLRGYMYGAAKTYVDTTLTAMTQSNALSAADQTHAKLLWAGYCEGKLWEFATSPLLARLYSERPTPNALCEAYYEDRKYFKDEALCGKDANGKDYFACIWNAGVVNSPLFPAKEITAVPACSGGSGTRAAAILSWVASDGSGPVRDLLRNNDPASPGDKINTYASTMRAAIMQGVTRFNSNLTGKAPALLKCRNAFARFAPTIPAGRDLDDKGVPYWQGDIAVNLVLIGETMPSDTVLRYNLLPLIGNSERDTANAAKLIGANAPFARRGVVGADYLPSFNDSQVNAVVGKPELLTSQANRDAVLAGPLFPNLGSYDAQNTLDLKTAAAAARTAVDQAQAAYDAKKDSFAKVSLEGIKANIIPTARAGESPGASVFLNTYVLTLTKDADQLCVRLRFEHMTDQSQMACLDLATNKARPVPPAELTADTHEATVAFDRAASLITFTFGLGKNPEKLGFPVYPREESIAAGDIPFNSLTPASLVDKSFQVQVYGNQLRDLPIVTGDAYILDTDGKTRLYSGSLTGDSFYQLRAQLSEANKLGI